MRAFKVLTFMYLLGNAAAVTGAQFPKKCAQDAQGNGLAMRDSMQEISASQYRPDYKNAPKDALIKIAANIQDEIDLYDLHQMSKTHDVNLRDDSGKTAFNYVMEGIFENSIDRNTIKHRLCALDFLLANGANPFVIRDVPSTLAIMQEAKTKYKKLKRRIENLCGHDCDPDEAYSTIFDSNDFMSHREQNTLVAAHAVTTLLNFAARIGDAQEQCNAAINSHASPMHKPLLVADLHPDFAKNIFFAQIVKTMLNIGISTICLELPEDASFAEHLQRHEEDVRNQMTIEKRYFLEHLRLIKKHKLKSIMLDKILATEESPIEYILATAAEEFFDFYHYNLRDRAMHFKSLQAILETDGKVAIMLGAAHIPSLMQYLHANGVESISVFPHTERLQMAGEPIASHGPRRLVRNYFDSLFSGGYVKDLHLPGQDPAQVLQNINEFKKLLQDEYSPKQAQSCKPA